MKKKKFRRIHKHFVGLNSMRLHHKIIFTLIGIVGVVMVWRGIWTIFDYLPVINHPLVSALLGFLLVAISGAFFKLF